MNSDVTTWALPKGAIARLNTVIIFHRQRVKQLLIVSWMPYKAISALQAP